MAADHIILPTTRVTGPLGSARMRIVAVGVMLVIALMGISAVVGFIVSSAEQARLQEDRFVSRQLRIFQQALIDAETGVRGFVLSGRVEYLEPYVAGTRVLDEVGGAALAELGGRPAAERNNSDPNGTLSALRRTWRGAIDLAEQDKRDAAQALLMTQAAKPMMDVMRQAITAELDARSITAARVEHRIALQEDLLLIINPAGALIALGATAIAFWFGARATRAQESTQREMEILFEMTEMLQSAADRDDANEVLRATAGRLLPGFSGALYVFNNSRDRLDLSTSWGETGEAEVADHISPQTCWALKRGRPHLSDASTGVACTHPGIGPVTLEIPMTARGELFGLLQLAAPGSDAATRLTGVRPIATALGDAMSLSLSSNALRDRLRNQALRDSLTGLYNRRFLEEMLDRLTQDATRRGTSVVAIMIDLDHFKRLNDQFGHAAGDAVLREVARVLMSELRATDVACRYGGEELLILLPDCGMETALERSEQLRIRIKEMGGASIGQTVTASFGVASIPGSASQGTELLAAADAALYRAKQEGRNRVIAAPLRNAPPPRLDHFNSNVRSTAAMG